MFLPPVSDHIESGEEPHSLEGVAGPDAGDTDQFFAALIRPSLGQVGQEPGSARSSSTSARDSWRSADGLACARTSGRSGPGPASCARTPPSAVHARAAPRRRGPCPPLATAWNRPRRPRTTSMAFPFGGPVALAHPTDSHLHVGPSVAAPLGRRGREHGSRDGRAAASRATPPTRQAACGWSPSDRGWTRPSSARRRDRRRRPSSGGCRRPVPQTARSPRCLRGEGEYKRTDAHRPRAIGNVLDVLVANTNRGPHGPSRI